MSSTPDAQGGFKPELNGFPPGYFVIRSLANGRMLDVEMDKAADGTPVLLWPEKESSLVESTRRTHLLIGAADTRPYRPAQT
jgi:hypothetical protein